MPRQQPSAQMDTPGDDWEFRGFISPTTTPVPDEVFDVLAPRLKEAELRVLLYIIRRTFGWKKIADNISLRQMVEGIRTKDGQVLDDGTGLSRRAVIQAVRSLVQRRVIIAIPRQSPEKGFEATTYSLNVLQPSTDRPPLLPKVTSPSYLSTHGLVTLGNPQQTVKQQTVNNNSVVVDLLSSKGITNVVAHRLASRYAADHIFAKVELLDYLVEIGSPLVGKNPAGYLRCAIEEDYQPPAGFQTKAEREAEATRQAEEEERLEAARQEHSRRTDAVALAMDRCGTTEEVRRIWQEAQDQLRLSMLDATYSTYVRNAVLLSLDQGVATLGVPNRYVKEWLEGRLALPVCRALEAIVGRPITLKAVVYTAEEVPSATIAGGT